MRFPVSRLLAGSAAAGILVVGVVACGGGSGASRSSASDRDSGLTVSVAGDQVTLKRSATSTAGTAGAAGQVGCTDDYRKLATATAEPAPTEPWYAATLITWPDTGKESTATLSHELKGDPDLCVAQTSDSTAQVVVYFRPSVKTEIAKLQQATQATSALQAAAQIAVAAVAKGSFPPVASLVQAIDKQGLYVETTADLGGVMGVGTMYVLTGRTTKTKLVLALEDQNGTVRTATQGVKGSPKIVTVKGKR